MLEHRLEFRGGLGSAQQESLGSIATQFEEFIHEIHRLDTLSDHLESEGLGQADGRIDNGPVACVDTQTSNEGLIEFQGVDRQVLELRHRAIARTEVIDGQGDAERLQFTQHVHGLLHILYDGVLRDLEAEQTDQEGDFRRGTL